MMMLETTDMNDMKKPGGERHKPVLLNEILDIFALNKDAVVVDCNLGDGGHSEAIIKKLNGNVHILGFDLDQEAIERTSHYLNSLEDNQIQSLIPIKANFSDMDVELAKRGYPDGSVDAVLFDLGLSTHDLISSGKGFSFKNDEPLLMTFGSPEDHAFTASDIVNSWKEEDIANVIFAYGEEHGSRRIAKKIVDYRKNRRIETSKELADLIAGVGPDGKAKHFKIHPATKTFQALRIAVNGELEHLKTALDKALVALKSGGKMAVISYHSLEDRIVKQKVKEWAKEGKVEEVTKKPTVPSKEETSENPRSRSAKLRAIIKK